MEDEPQSKKNFWSHLWTVPGEVWRSLSLKEKEYLKSGLLIIGICGLLSTVILPLLMTWPLISVVDFSKTGEIGDTIGGISAPFIGILSAVLTFLAFYIQYQANVQQRDQFKKELQRQQDENVAQQKTWRIERFEDKFFELVRLHRDNVDEIQIGREDRTVTKKKAFASMFYELKYTFYACKALCQRYREQGHLHQGYSDERLLRLAYIFFYAGIGPNSDIITDAMNLNPANQFEHYLFRQTRNDLAGFRERGNYATYRDEDENEVRSTSLYKPWGGHQTRLGHYYRHLFQTVKFVVKQNAEMLTTDDKLEYLRTLRAQLSDFEQLMLYYNAVAGFGTPWINEGYFTTYKMIHNIPVPLANFGIRPEIRFATELAEQDLFEWLE